MQLLTSWDIQVRTMMLDLFHESLRANGVSCDRQHFHGFLKAVDTSFLAQKKRAATNTAF